MPIKWRINKQELDKPKKRVKSINQEVDELFEYYLNNEQAFKQL